MKAKTAAEVLDSIDWEKVGRIATLGDAVREKSNTPDKWSLIRKLYAECMPDIMAAGKYHGVDPYFTDWAKLFTPIEDDAWQSIRYYGVPFYPQFPVLNYFIDFANPVRQIGLELDGAQWHDRERDLVRDRRLYDEGWTIFRIPGRQTKVSYDNPFDCDEEDEHKIRHWLMNTSDGVIYAIKECYFSRPSKWREWAVQSLETHCLLGGSLYELRATL